MTTTTTTTATSAAASEQGTAHSTPSEIVALLVGVIRAKTKVEARFAEGGLRGTVDMIHPSGSYFIFTCEGSPEDAMRAAQSEKLVFNASHAAVRLEFVVAGKDVRVAHNDTVLLVQLPKLLLRFDRRVGQRVALPPSHAVRCAVPFPQDGSVLPNEFQAYDISVSGIALISRSGARLEVGAQIDNCTVKLSNGESFTVTLEVRHAMEKTIDGVASLRAGCRFIDPSSTMQAAILRYITGAQLASGAPSLDFQDLEN